MIHYFDNANQAYTSCYRLTGGQLAVKYSANLSEITCPICLDRLAKHYLSLSPKEINAILVDCDIDAALEFLEILGHVRAAEIARKLKCI